MLKHRSTFRVILLTALMYFFGLQAFRVFLPKIIWYGGDFLNAVQQALFALVLFCTIWFAPLLRRWLGERLLFIITAGGMPLIYAGYQVARSPLAYLVLACLGIVLWGWFVPFWQTGRRRLVEGVPVLVLALPLAFLLDTLLRNLFWGYDLAWQHTPASVILTIVIAGAGLSMVSAEVRGWKDHSPAEEPGFGSVLPLLALGPFMYLAMATLHNGAAFAVASGLDDQLAYTLSVVFAALGVAACLFAGLFVKARRAVALVNGVLLILVPLLLYLNLGKAWSLAWLAYLVLSIVLWGGMGILLAAITRPGARRKSMLATTLASFSALVLMLAILFMIAQYEMYWMTVVAAGIVWLASVWAVLANPAHGTQKFHLRTVGQKFALGAAAGSILVIGAWALAVESLPVTTVLSAGAPLRVMTYNIHQGINADLMVDLQAIADAIAAENPDVVALNEVNRARATNGFMDVLPLISRKLGMSYVFGANYADGQYGNAILSRYPIVEADNTHYRTNTTEVRGALRAVIQAPGGNITFFATHLDHIGSANNARAAQVAELLALWNQQPRSIILGDMNANPDTQDLAAYFQTSLVDAIAAAGQDKETTFWGQEGRIDYIFITPDLGINTLWIPQTRASDHKPVVVEILSNFIPY